VFAPVAPPSGFVVPVTAPLAREVVAGWLRRRGGHVSEAPFMNGERRWNYSPSATARCQVH
jgi:hypothetical protein